MTANFSNQGTEGIGEVPSCQTELLATFDLLVDVLFCIKDSSGRYLAVNNAFVRRVGRQSKRDVIGRSVADFFIPELAERYIQQDTQVISSGKGIRDELELIREESGKLGWYLTTKLPLGSNQSLPVEALIIVSRDLKTPASDDVDALALTRVVQYVRQNLEQKIRIADLAEAANISISQLERRMKKTFGLSPSKYLIRARVDKAAELLSDPDIPLADVALRAGFYDQANLTHQFARLTNETPAQFRATQQRLP